MGLAEPQRLRILPNISDSPRGFEGKTQDR
jgi:hypothetical protein